MVKDSIHRRMKEYLADPDPRFAWARAAVRTHGFLPLYIGWMAALGIRPDGTLVRWDHEEEPESVKTLADPYLARLALCQGAKRYPELEQLIPTRPPQAETCAPCGGTGALEAHSNTLICECGGAGWLIPGESRPNPGIG